MSGINSLVGATDPTFVFSDGPSNTWMDNWRPTTWATEVAKNFKDDEYNFKENRPNYDPENYPGYTKMANTNRKWLDMLKLLRQIG